MTEPEQDRGTIIHMICPECGDLGMKFIKGDGALDRWKDELTMIRYVASEPTDEMDAAVDSANEAFRDVFAVPDHVPDTAQVLPNMLECGFHTFVESIRWDNIPRRAVR